MSEKKPVRHNPGFAYTPEEAVERMLARISAAPGAWNEGVQATKKDVMALAASDEAEANFKAAMLAVLNAKLRQLGLREISTEEWKRIISEKSMAWSTGVAAKADKIRRKVTAAIRVTYDVATEVQKLPRGLPGSDENKQRMIQYFERRVKAKKTTGT